MHSDEQFSDFDSDPDDIFNEDMEFLRRACLSAGANPNDLSTTNPQGGATTEATSMSSYDDDDDAEDDIEYVQNLQKRFGNFEEPLTLKPSFSLQLVEADDDCEDDLKTLRAIQRRFSAYNNGGLKESADNSLHKPKQVGVTNKIASEKEASNNLFVERNNDAEKGFPDCVDTDNTTPPNRGEDGLVVETDLVEWHDSGAEDVAASTLKTSSLPKPALAFIDAIKKNRSCQKVIRSKLMQLEARMEEIKKLKERVKILKDFQVGCKKRTSQALSQKKDARVQLISAAKQRPSSKLIDKKIPAMHYGPPENRHAAIYREALTRFPISVVREKWSKKEAENLAKGLKQQVQEMLLQQYVNSLNDADGSPGDGSDFDSFIASIRDHEITPQTIRLFLPKINWEQLASMYVPSRSGAECLARWLNWEDPLINRNPWTTVEEKNLLHIIQQKGMSNWIDIAASLGTNRTPFQCLAHYQRSLNASIIRREWTKEEDDKLRAAVEEYGESHWQVAASVMEGRTGTQCSNRWKKTLHPSRKRIGKWTPEEDKRLKVAVKLFGTKWWKIAEFVPGRMQSQCRERWVNTLDPSLNLDKWTPEEDLMLEEAMKENGYCWSLVAACIPRRTDNQCRRRWMILFPKEVPMLRQAKKMQKAALISNFVDRESDRPALGPNDFLQSPEIDQSSEPEYVNPSVKKKKKMFRKSRNLTEKDTSASNTFSEEIPGAANATEPEDGQAVGTSCGDLVIQSGKGSRRQKRKSIADDAIHTSVEDGDGITVKNKRLKSRSNRKKSACSDTAEHHLSSLPNSTLEVANNKVERHDRTKIKNVNRKSHKPCLRNELADLSISTRNAPKDSRLASEADEGGENDKFKEVPQTQSLTPMIIPESGNNRYSIARKGCKNKKSKFRDGAGSSMVLEVEEDNMAKGSSLPGTGDNPISSPSLAESGSTEVQCTATRENYSSPAGVSCRNRPKRARTRDETSSRSFKKLKKTRTEPARNADDNNTLSLVCQELEEPTRTHPIEIPDDMTLSVFCKKMSADDNTTISLVCEESEEPTRTEPMEIPDDMTLSGFCKKMSADDNNTISLVCEESEEPTRTEPLEMPDDMTLSVFCKKLKQRRGRPAEKY